MRPNYACDSVEHFIARRSFLTTGLGMTAVLTGIGGLTQCAAAETLAAQRLSRQQKRILLFNMHGGLSQLETWDPKPGTETGGPFRAIPTSVPGIHISELLPKTAMQMHHLCLLRGVNTSEDDHGKGAYMMLTGRRQSAAANYPELGAVAAKSLVPENSAMPGHIRIVPWGGGGRGNDAAYLGPKYSSVALGNGKPPQYTVLPDGIDDDSETRRHAFRRSVDQNFASQHRSTMTDAFLNSYEAAAQLMQQRETFDVEKESPADQDRYGKHDFGRHCLLARRLLQHDVPFVQVMHSNYDTHNENFDFHHELVPQFDGPFATLIADLADSGLLEDTLVIVMSEFGRTPNINLYMGRDHWSKAWSIVMAGCNIARGAAFGETSANGTEVTDGQVDHAQLFHTYLHAVGVDSSNSFLVDGREMPLADPAAEPIWKVLT
ncbi:MAG: DUF1501 domain-containing protein [Planctomycetales bacterium]|nr:DUF1501 domain-containing protein [Planctomycetales bacterium]